MNSNELSQLLDRYGSLSNDELFELVQKRCSLTLDAQKALDQVLSGKGLDARFIEHYAEVPRAKRTSSSTALPIVRRLFYVLLAGWVTFLPSALISYWHVNTSFWYLSLLVMIHAIGGGTFASVIGATFGLLAQRDRPDGGLRAAVLVTTLCSLCLGFFQWYGRIGIY